MSIDTKAKGGMVVAPPSRHVSGGEYRWLVEPESIALAKAPDWLIEVVTGKKVSNAKQPIFTVEDNDIRTAPGVSEGQRNSRLCQLVGAELSRSGHRPDLLQVATEWARRCEPPLPEREVQKVVGSLVARHLSAASTNGKPAKVACEHRAFELGCISFDDIESKPIDWLWAGRFPLGKLTLLTGDGGVGKSLLTCDLAARVSKGSCFPDSSPCPQGDVFLVGSEDGAEDTIRPRLDAAGADVSRIHLIRGPIPPGEKYAMPVDLSRHIALLDDLLAKQTLPKLVVIDPVFDYLGQGINSDKATDVRGVLAPLRELAERHQVAVVLINHLNKSARASKCRSLGSGAFCHVCRVELRVVEDPEQPDRRLLLVVKNNLAAPRGLAYRIVSTPSGVGVAEWEEGFVDVAIDEVETDDHSEPRGAMAEAAAWLIAQLSEGPLTAADITARATRDGISCSTRKRAKARLRVRSYQQNKEWWWDLPIRGETGVSVAPAADLQDAFPVSGETGDGRSDEIPDGFLF